jgi:hypothetical protein
MDVQRIDGIKYDLDRQTDAELENIRANLIERHARLTGEIALLDECILDRNAVMLEGALNYGRDE